MPDLVFDQAAVETLLRNEAAARGVTYDPSDLQGIIRNTGYAVGAQTLDAAIANQVRIYDTRAAPTMQRTVDSQSAAGQALYGSGADLRPVYVPLSPSALATISAAARPTPPTIMLSGGSDLYGDPGRALLSGELTSTSLPNRPLGNLLAGEPSVYRGTPGPGLQAAAAGLPSWVWLAGAGVLAYVLWKR